MHTNFPCEAVLFDVLLVFQVSIEIMLCYTDFIVSIESACIYHILFFFRPRIKRFLIIFLVGSVTFHIMLQQSRIRIVRG